MGARLLSAGSRGDDRTDATPQPAHLHAHKVAVLQAAEEFGCPDTGTGAAPLSAAFAAAGRLVSADGSHAAPCAAAALKVLQHGMTGKPAALLPHCHIQSALLIWLSPTKTLPCHAMRGMLREAMIGLAMIGCLAVTRVLLPVMQWTHSTLIT